MIVVRKGKLTEINSEYIGIVDKIKNHSFSYLDHLTKDEVGIVSSAFRYFDGLAQKMEATQ